MVAFCKAKQTHFGTCEKNMALTSHHSRSASNQTVASNDASASGSFQASSKTSQPLRSFRLSLRLPLIWLLSITSLIWLSLGFMIFLIRSSTAQLRALQHYMQDWTKHLSQPASEVRLVCPDKPFPAIQQQDEIGDLARAFDQLLKLVAANQEQVTQLYEESRRQEALLTATFQSVTDGIVIYNNQGEIVSSNAAANLLVGQAFVTGEAVEERVKSRLLYTLDGQKLLWQERPSQRALREVFSNYELRLALSENPGGLPDRILNHSGGPIINDQGQRQGAVTIFRDVTEAKEAEARLIERQAEVIALKNSNEVKNRFISLVSHQLRTPLTGVMGFAELLTIRQLSPAVVQEYAQGILASAERMTEMLSEMLNLQRLEAGAVQFKFEAVDLSQMINQMLDSPEFRPYKNIEFKAGPAVPLAHADQNYLRQALENLLTNALKYSIPGSPVELDLSEVNEGLQIRVQDYGHGIPLTNQSHIFERFYRGEASRTSHTPGTGLGLAITQEIILAHQGKIWFESVEGKGSTFFFIIPGHQL